MVDSDNIRGAIEQLPDQLREGGRIGGIAGERLPHARRGRARGNGWLGGRR